MTPEGVTRLVTSRSVACLRSRSTWCSRGDAWCCEEVLWAVEGPRAFGDPLLVLYFHLLDFFPRSCLACEARPLARMREGIKPCGSNDGDDHSKRSMTTINTLGGRIAHT